MVGTVMPVVVVEQVVVVLALLVEILSITAVVMLVELGKFLP
jgi:hypothetical protein